MYKLTIKFNNGTESTYKIPLTRDKIEGISISDCPSSLFLRYSSIIPKVKELLENNKYLYIKDSIFTYFGASITSFEKMGDCSVESKSLCYFIVDEILRNF